MSVRRRATAAILTAALLVLLVVTALLDVTVTGQESGSLFSARETVVLWYTDDALTDFLNETAVRYNRAHSQSRVEMVRKDSVEFLDQVNNASIEGKDFPDLYIVSNDMLGRAWLAGLALDISGNKLFSDGHFCSAALNAVTCSGRRTAWPLYFETSALVYNEDYVRAMAESAGRAPEEMVPDTITDIISFADAYAAPAQVESVFSWDVNDIFYNYYFAGNYLDVGGPCGDDTSRFRIYDADVVRCMQVYQQLNQFFSIDTEKVDYERIVSDFAGGHMVFTVATSDLPGAMRTAAEAGETPAYGVTSLPAITAELPTRAMSVTYGIAANAYTTRADTAYDFIDYLYRHLDGFYDATGKGPAVEGYAYSDYHMDAFYASYRESVPIPKMRETGNFWMLLENAFLRIWNGADAGETLRLLYEQTMLGITGREFTAEPIEIPEPLDLRAQLEGMD